MPRHRKSEKLRRPDSKLAGAISYPPGYPPTASGELAKTIDAIHRLGINVVVRWVERGSCYYVTLIQGKRAVLFKRVNLSDVIASLRQAKDNATARRKKP